MVRSDVVVVEGDPSITLECIADGEPTPNITWTKVYANGSDSGVLGTGNQFVLETNRNNSGKYRCTAYNGIGTAIFFLWLINTFFHFLVLFFIIFT